MARRLALGLALIVPALVVLAACRAEQARPTTPHALHPPVANLVARGLAPAADVTHMESLCAEGRVERCDALDDDCDGAIDEGCDGALAGDLALALAWNTPATLELALEAPGDPAGRESSPSSCDGPRLARRAYAAPLAGAYAVSVRHLAVCRSEAPTTASVTVAHGGRVLGTFNVVVAAGATAQVVRFELAPE